MSLTVGEGLGWFYLSMTGVRSLSTITWYRQRLGRLASYLGQDCQIEAVTVDRLRGWRTSWNQTTSPFVE